MILNSYELFLRCGIKKYHVVVEGQFEVRCQRSEVREQRIATVTRYQQIAFCFLHSDFCLLSSVICLLNLTPRMKLRLAGTVNRLNVEHRTSNIERPILMTLRFIDFKTSESQPATSSPRRAWDLPST